MIGFEYQEIPLRGCAGDPTHPKYGLCAMQMVSFFAGEEISDNPKCSSKILACYTQMLNDEAGKEQRLRLWPLIFQLIGSYNPKNESKRRNHICRCTNVGAPWDKKLTSLQEAILMGKHGELDPVAQAPKLVELKELLRLE